MPFTPFHMGPALAFKVVSGRHFSVLVFGLAQVAMDVEPLVGMLGDSEVLHGWTHTWLGATLIGLMVAAAAPPLARMLVLQWNQYLEGKGYPWLASPPGISRLAAASGAMLGTWSHVLLDGTMHADMHPLAPWSQENALLEAVSSGELHFACVIAGVVGLMFWLLAGMFRRDRAAASATASPSPDYAAGYGPFLSSRPAVFLQRQTFQFAAGSVAALAVSASVPMLLGTVTWGGWGDAVVFACVAAGWGAFGGGLFSLGTAWAGMQRLPAGPAPLAAGALATASWILLRLWMDTLPVEPGVAGASAEYTRGGLGTIWVMLAPALAGMACAWHARWRRARDAASGPAAR